MKKEKQPSPAKTARKAIHEHLLSELKNIAAKLQKDGITIIADIEKEAKKLAKKLTKGAKTDQPESAPAAKEKPAVKTPEKKATTATEKPVAKAPVKKMVEIIEKQSATVPEKKVESVKEKTAAKAAATKPKADTAVAASAAPKAAKTTQKK